MLEVYKDNKALDSRCVHQFELSDEILMENAGVALRIFLENLTHQGSVISIVCGGGDNGGDGYVLARQLNGDYKVRVLVAKEPKSSLCIKQYHRALATGVECVKKLLPCDVVVDCLIGSGMKSRLDEATKKTIEMMQKVGRIKIACDIPSGINQDGEVEDIAFCADYTLAMGGINLALLSDVAKNYIGKISIGNLGVSRQKYSLSSQIKLLEKSDLNLPKRQRADSHKGDFGHLCVYAGNKSGAGNLSGLAGLGFGVGAVSVIGSNYPYFAELMYEEKPNAKMNAFCVGMGMGEKIPDFFFEIDKAMPCVLDADILSNPKIEDILEEYQNLVLTPHYGEFLKLWEICFKATLDKDVFLKKKVDYAMEWSQKYPNATLVLKGANVFIVQKSKVFINPFGNVALAKAGSGDVLAGMIGALLAQGRTTLESSIQASLAHSLCAEDFETKNYALRPLELIAQLSHFGFQG